MAKDRQLQLMLNDHEVAAMNVIRLGNLKNNYNCTMSGAFKKAAIFYAEVMTLGLEAEVQSMIDDAKRAQAARMAQQRPELRPSDFDELPEVEL